MNNGGYIPFNSEAVMASYITNIDLEQIDSFWNAQYLKGKTKQPCDFLQQQDLYYYPINNKINAKLFTNGLVPNISIDLYEIKATVAMITTFFTQVNTKLIIFKEKLTKLSNSVGELESIHNTANNYPVIWPPRYSGNLKYTNTEELQSYTILDIPKKIILSALLTKRLNEIAAVNNSLNDVYKVLTRLDHLTVDYCTYLTKLK